MANQKSQHYLFPIKTQYLKVLSHIIWAWLCNYTRSIRLNISICRQLTTLRIWKKALIPRNRAKEVRGPPLQCGSALCNWCIMQSFSSSHQSHLHYFSVATKTMQPVLVPLVSGVLKAWSYAWIPWTIVFFLYLPRRILEDKSKKVNKRQNKIL